MANMCVYKIKVIGTKKACYAFVDMMPACSDKYVESEEGTDEECTLVFTGDCKWEVDYATKRGKVKKPFTEEEIDEIEDGDGWDIPMKEKSLALNCDVWCSSMDLDAGHRHFVHYDKGEKIKGSCPKELKVTRGDW